MKKGKGIKVIVSMIGLDGHTTGAEVVSTILRDAGFEVVYLGVNQTPAMIVRTAVEEDVDVIGISLHASNYSQIEELMARLEENGLSNVPVLCGGNMPPHQIARLKAKGVAEVFVPGTSGSSLIDRVVSVVRGSDANS